MGAADETLASPVGTGEIGDVVAAPARRAVLAPGDRLAQRYTVVRFLGRGGMGEVYEAEDRELSQTIALKVLRAAADPRALDRLRREIATARMVTHANVCRVFDVEHHETADADLEFFTMELLRGETLADRIERCGKLATAAALPIVEDVIAGLAAAHEAGVIHRDFKPHNVMLVRRGDTERAVITDFGLAVLAESADPTRSMDLLGTPAYMAPEQLTGAAITAAVDVYALGITMFEMVTGELPFSAATPLATALARVHVDAPSPRTLTPDLDPRWELAIRRCLQRDPKARFATARELATALRDGRRKRRWPVAMLGLAAVTAGVFAIAATRSSEPPVDAFIARPDGIVQRFLPVAGPGVEMVEQVTEDDGRLLVAGHFSSNFRIGAAEIAHPGLAATAGFVVKLDRDGGLLWKRTFAGTGSTSIRHVLRAGDGSLVIAGSFRRGEIDLGGGHRHRTAATSAGFIAGLSASTGATSWVRVVDSTPKGLVDTRVIGLGPDGNIYVAGELIGVADFGGRSHDGGETSPFVASYAPGGALRWLVPGTGGTNARARAIAFRGGDVLVAGSAAGRVQLGNTTWTNDRNREPFLIAIDRATGAPTWGRTFGAEFGEPRALAVSPDGRILVGGNFVDSIEPARGQRFTVPHMVQGAWIAEIDARDGSSLWARQIGTGAHPTGVSTFGFVDDRILVFGGFDQSLEIAGRTLTARSSDIYILTLDRTGEPRAATALGGHQEQRVRRVEVRPDGILTLYGRHAGITLGDLTVKSQGLHDGFYAELRLAELLR